MFRLLYSFDCFTYRLPGRPDLAFWPDCPGHLSPGHLVSNGIAPRIDPHKRGRRNNDLPRWNCPTCQSRLGTIQDTCAPGALDSNLQCFPIHHPPRPLHSRKRDIYQDTYCSSVSPNVAASIRCRFQPTGQRRPAACAGRALVRQPPRLPYPCRTGERKA